MQKQICILLIEDDVDDVELLEDALKGNNIDYRLHLVNDGAKALNYFQNDNEHPDIIILDFNLPKIHGREVLKEIKSSKYSQIPLMVLTTSSSKEDKEYALQNHANLFLVKPNT